jgi:tRNA-Thr(GGU) m(6)t(6)A37 methyltransferase TsaA
MSCQKDKNADGKVSMRPIAYLRSDFRQRFVAPRQGALVPHSRAELELAQELRGRGLLDGLEGFSHVWLISHLHESVNTRQRGKVHPPRLQGKKIGILASRTPHRPNPIGLTLAKIESVHGDRLVVSGIDLIEGTPILDLKPYLAQADRPENFSSGWTDLVRSLELTCTFSEEAEATIQTLHQNGRLPDPQRFRALLSESLRLDPRPPAYKNRPDFRFASLIGDFNVVFRLCGQGFLVVAIEPPHTRPAGRPDRHRP